MLVAVLVVETVFLCRSRSSSPCRYPTASRSAFVIASVALFLGFICATPQRTLASLEPLLLPITPS